MFFSLNLRDDMSIDKKNALLITKCKTLTQYLIVSSACNVCLLIALILVGTADKSREPALPQEVTVVERDEVSISSPNSVAAFLTSIANDEYTDDSLSSNEYFQFLYKYLQKAGCKVQFFGVVRLIKECDREVLISFIEENSMRKKLERQPLIDLLRSQVDTSPFCASIFGYFLYDYAYKNFSDSLLSSTMNNLPKGDAPISPLVFKIAEYHKSRKLMSRARDVLSQEPPVQIVKKARDSVKHQNVKYIVRKGDSLWAIANKNGTNVKELQKLNNLQKNSTLKVGQSIILR